MRKNDVFNMVLTNYNYISGDLNYQKVYENEYPLSISLSDKTNTILLSSWGPSYLLDYNSGEEKTFFSIGERVIESYSINNSDYYLLFTSSGTVHTIDGGLNSIENDVVYLDLFNFNLSNYENFIYLGDTIISYTNRDNRIVVYGKLKNDDITKIDYKEKTFDNKLNNEEKESIIDEYNFERKNLVDNIFYSNDDSNSRKLLFVSYTDKTLSIYNNETKELLNTIQLKNNVDTYLGKTKNEEYIIKGVGGGFIFNKDFELIAYVPRLYDYNNEKLIIRSEENYYEVKIYTKEELILKADNITKIN